MESLTRARLIPVTGIDSEREAEGRATSALLAVLSVVRDLSIQVFTPMGASKAQAAMVETFTEPRFKVKDRNVRPDGLVRISFGKKSWSALVEVKTGTALPDDRSGQQLLGRCASREVGRGHHDHKRHRSRSRRPSP